MTLSRSLRTLLLAGLVAGALDLCFAFTSAGLRGIGPGVVLQAIASGLLGRAAYAGGVPVIVLGFMLHFAMTITMAAALALVVHRWPALAWRPLLLGLGYGALLYVVMSFVVVPLSQAVLGPPPANWAERLPQLLAHMVLVGIPCALGAARSASLPWRGKPRSA